MEQLTLTEKNGENYILLELNGTINSYTATEFRNKVFTYIATTNLVLDLSEVHSIDSTGMGIIMAGFNDGIESKHKLFLMNPSAEARQVIDDTGFSDTFIFIHSVTEVN
jgi:anti-anti-sigma factor